MRRLIPYCIVFFLMAASGALAQTKDSTNFNNEPMENINTLPGKKDTLKTGAVKVDSLKAKRDVRKAIYGKARTAAILSAVIPGAGQAYNKQYWKMPVIYVALGGLGYWISTNQREYKKYSNQLRDYYRDYPYTNGTAPPGDPTSMAALKHQHQKSRDLGFILCGVVYALNIIDANVSAHLKTFDVSDDLSLQFKPYYRLGLQNDLQTGLSIKLTFK